MIEKFLKYARDLEKSKDLVPMYEDLVSIFNNDAMYQAEACCIEKIWNITQKHELLNQIGDIFLNRVQNSQIALAAYNRYLQFVNPKFFKMYMTTLTRLGFTGFDPSDDNKDYSRELIRLCDNFDTIFYMMLYLHKHEDYSAIIQLEEYLIKYKTKVQEFLKKHPEEEMEMLEEIVNNGKYLSQVLAKTKHRNDINQLAICLNPENKEAYINILEDLISYNNYNLATEFYNNQYSKAFNIPQKHNIIDICWEISDFNRDKYEFAQAVFFQKIALELELAEGKPNA